MMPGLLMIFLTRKPEEADVLEVVAESVFISIGVNVVLMLISTFYYDPARLYLLLFISVYTFITVSILIFSKNRVVRIDFFDLGTSAVIFLIGLSFCLAMYGNIFKYFVEDDVEYIVSARLLLSKGYIYLQASNDYENIINYLTGRVFWSSLLSSFLAATGIPPFKSYILNLLFIVAIGHAIASFFTKEKTWRFLTALIVISNPLLINLSLYVYSALLEAFFMSVFMLYLRRSLEKGKLNSALVTANAMLVFLTQTIKLQMNILLSSFLVLIKLIYDYPKKIIVKKIVILIILLFVVYEGLIDFPYIYYKYVEADASKASIFEKLDFTKLLEQPAFLFIRTRESPKIIFDYSFTELLKFIYVAFSPSSYSVPLLVSIWSALLIQLARKNSTSIGWIKYASYLVASSFLINFIYNLAIDNYGGLTKYIVPFLPIFLLIGIYNISIMFKDVMPKWYFITSIFLAFIIFILNFMAQQLVGIYAIYTVESPSNFFFMLMNLETLIYMLLLLAILLISLFKISLKIKISKKYELIIRKHKLEEYISFIIIALIFFNNVFSNYFVFFASPNIKPGQDAHLKELSSYLDNTDSRIIFFNDYMFILPYLSNKILLSSFTGYLPISSKELSYLTDSSNVNLTIVKDDTWANWIHKMFSDNELKRKFYSSNLYSIFPNNEECTTHVQLYKVMGDIRCIEYEYKGGIYPGDTYVITNSSLKRIPLNIVRFDGETSLSVSFEDILNTTQLTYLMWIRPDENMLENKSYCLLAISLSNNRVIFATKGYRDSVAPNLFYYYYDSKTYSNFKEDSSNILDAHKWTFFAVVLSKGEPVKVYVNGLLRFVSEEELPEETLNIKGIYISNPVWPDSHSWRGYISNLMIYSRALSYKEIQNIYRQNALEVPKDHLIVWYTFDPKDICNGSIRNMATGIADAYISGKLEKNSINAKQHNVRIVVPQYMDVKLYDSYGKLLASFSPNEFGEVLFDISDYTNNLYLNGTIKIIPNIMLSEGLIIKNISNISSPYHTELKFEKWNIYNWNQTHIAIEATVNSPAFINSTFILSSMRFTKVYLVSVGPGINKIVFLLPSHIYAPIKYPFGSSFSFFTKVLVIADGKVLSSDIVHYDTYLGKLSLIYIIFSLVGLIYAFTIGTPRKIYLFKKIGRN
jgi:hypothetical protein